MLASSGYAEARHTWAARRANEVGDKTCTMKSDLQGNLASLPFNTLGKLIQELSDQTTMVLTRHGRMQ